METFDWLKPAPLWQENGRDLLLPAYRDSFRRPQMLAYQSDNFMEEFFAAASAGDPNQFPIAENGPLITSDTLRLFQPAHGNFYLVCASLCCVRPGFPDRAVRTSDEESIYFVLRKRQEGVEYGWVLGPTGPLGWQAVTDASEPVLDGEEKLPLAVTTGGDGRRLAFGYLPVASRDSYQAAPATLPGTPVETGARLMELQGRFSRQLPLVGAIPDGDAFDPPDPPDEVALRLSIYMFLDLWEYLQTYLPPVGEALAKDDGGDLDGANAKLFTFLQEQALGGSVTLAGALHQVATKRNKLNGLGEDDLPDPFHEEFDYTLKGRTLDTETLETNVEAALAAADEAKGAEEAPVTVPKLRPDTGETFVVRCVYERPLCSQKRYWVSQPSIVFQMASFYDPDAPARPVRMQLPDMSMSSLRRFKKGVGFIMSPDLQGKIGGIGSSEIDLLDRNLLELGLGYLCTFSLPIITLCAFILLLVMVIVLNLVFWWLPFFKICLPVPQVE